MSYFLITPAGVHCILFDSGAAKSCNLLTCFGVRTTLKYYFSQIIIACDEAGETRQAYHDLKNSYKF